MPTLTRNERVYIKLENVSYWLNETKYAQDFKAAGSPVFPTRVGVNRL